MATAAVKRDREEGGTGILDTTDFKDEGHINAVSEFQGVLPLSEISELGESVDYKSGLRSGVNDKFHGKQGPGPSLVTVIRGGRLEIGTGPHPYTEQVIDMEQVFPAHLVEQVLYGIIAVKAVDVLDTDTAGQVFNENGKKRSATYEKSVEELLFVAGADPVIVPDVSMPHGDYGSDVGVEKVPLSPFPFLLLGNPRSSKDYYKEKNNERGEISHGVTVYSGDS
jgi:hypothetical protein